MKVNIQKKTQVAVALIKELNTKRKQAKIRRISVPTYSGNREYMLIGMSAVSHLEFPNTREYSWFPDVKVEEKVWGSIKENRFFSPEHEMSGMTAFYSNISLENLYLITSLNGIHSQDKATLTHTIEGVVKNASKGNLEGVISTSQLRGRVQPMLVDNPRGIIEKKVFLHEDNPSTNTLAMSKDFGIEINHMNALVREVLLERIDLAKGCLPVFVKFNDKQYSPCYTIDEDLYVKLLKVMPKAKDPDVAFTREEVLEEYHTLFKLLREEYNRKHPNKLELVTRVYRGWYDDYACVLHELFTRYGLEKTYHGLWVAQITFAINAKYGVHALSYAEKASLVGTKLKTIKNCDLTTKNDIAEDSLKVRKLAMYLIDTQELNIKHRPRLNELLETFIYSDDEFQVYINKMMEN